MKSETMIDEATIDHSAQGIASPRIVAASFIEYVYQFFRQTEVHDSTNQIFDRCLDNFERAIGALRKLPGFEDIEVSFRGEQIYVNKTRLRPKSRHFRKHRFLLKFMRRRNLGSLMFPSDFQRKELLGFLWAVAKVDPNSNDPLAGFFEELEKLGLGKYGANLAHAYQNIDAQKDDASLVDMEVVSLVLHEKIRKFSELVFENFSRASAMELPDLRSNLKDLVQLSEEDLMQIFRSNLMKRRDRPFGFIAADTCVAAIAWGRTLGIPQGVLEELAGAALAHPFTYILRGREFKSSALTKEEGIKLIELLEEIKNVWPLTELQRLVVFEWMAPHGNMGIYDWDGTKCYSHFFSRMIRILASFRAMTHFESNKETFLPDEAMAQMMKSPGEFDPTLLKLFVNWMGIYPVGTLVLLRGGELAQVFAGGSDPLKFQRPIVSIFKDSDGNLLDRPRLVDLTEMNERLGVYKRSIQKSLSFEEAGIPENVLNVMPASL